MMMPRGGLLVVWSCATALMALRIERTAPKRAFGDSFAVDADMDEHCKAFLAQLQQPAEQVCPGPFRSLKVSKEKQHKVAFVFRGESFRKNDGMYDRVVDATDRAIDCQFEATTSQVNHLIKPLEACGISVDVFISSWKPEGDEVDAPMKMLVDKFQPRVVSEDWPEHSLGMAEGVNGQQMNYDNAWKAVVAHYEETGEGYDGIFLLRNDLLFKRPLVNLENADWAKLLYAFHEWEMGGGTGEVVPQRIPDTMVWFPWKFANCVQSVGWAEHNHMMAVSGSVGLESIGFMMPDEFHNSSSASDRNPLYKMACREEQAYEIHGGPAVVLFSAHEVTDVEMATQSGSSFISSLFHQGKPQLIQPTKLVMHSWSSDPQVQESLGKSYGLTPAGVLHDRFNGSVDVSGWSHALVSMKKSYELLVKATAEVLGGNPEFTYDSVAFARLDHTFPAQHLELYDFDTSESVFVWFGDDQCSSVPTLMLMSHEAAWKLGDSLIHNDLQSEDSPEHVGVTSWLERETGLLVKTM